MRNKIISLACISCFCSLVSMGQNIRGYIHITDSTLAPQKIGYRADGIMKTSNMKMNRILSDRTVPVYRQAFPTAKSEWLRNVYYIESPDADVFNDIENELKGNVDLIELLDDEPQPDYKPNDYDRVPTKFYDLIKVQGAWDMVKDVPKIPIAIIDSYFDTTHVDLKGQFVNIIDNNDPTVNRADHGTSVAGLIAAIPNNGIGFPGVGYGMKLYASTAKDFYIK